MTQIDRPLSRRSFFKAAGITTVAMSSASALVPRTSGAETAAGGIDPKIWDEVVKWAVRDGLPNTKKHRDRYRALVEDFWGHFRYGTQDVPFEGTDLKMVTKAYEFEVPDLGKAKKGSGRHYVKRLPDLKPGSDKEVNSRYCCYLCGYFALESARKRAKGAPPEINETDYEEGWKEAKARVFNLFDRASGRQKNAGQQELYGAGC